MSPSKINGQNGTTEIDYETFYNIIDGQHAETKGKPAHGINPATGEELWDVPVASKEDLDRAVAAANEAFVSWSQTSIDERRNLLNQFVQHYMSPEVQQSFMTLLQKETGKPFAAAQLEVQGVAGFVGFHATLNIPEEKMEDEEKVITTRYTPLGVVGAICPWNFPLVLSSGKIAPALLTGNTIIIKPSPFTPYSSLKLVELMQKFFPPGVVQAVGGNNELGALMCEHPDIHKISFTGSIATGKKVMAAASKTLKRVTLELGGNDASIILPDVDIEYTAKEVVRGAFQNSGQVCVATKRIYIHESIYKEFVEAMVNFTKTLKVGTADQDADVLGPVQNQMQYDRVKGFFEDSKAQGYKFAVGAPEFSGKGFYVQPTIIDNPPAGSRIIEEEPFGPIVPTQPWSDEEEVIKRANNTNTGLGACVWGNDVEHAERIARRLQAGSVFVNSYEKATPQAIFSGHKESGIGGEWGQTGLLAYCNAHVIHNYKLKNTKQEPRA